MKHPSQVKRDNFLEMNMFEQRFEYVGFWARVGASLIDTVIVLLITLPPLWAISQMTTSGFVNGAAELLIAWIAPSVIVIALWLRKAATPGKMAFSAKVLDASTGMPLTLGQAVGRYLAYFVSIFPLGLGLLWVAFDSKKQGWHDKLAGTVVVRVKR